MGEYSEDDLAKVEAIPAFDRLTSKFEWYKRPAPSSKPPVKTYGFEIEGGQGFIADGIRVGNPANKKR